MSLGVIGIILGLLVLVGLAYLRVNILVASAASAVVVLLCNGLPLWESISTNYMAGFAAYTQSYFLIFASCALFGKLMEKCGAAKAVAGLICKACSEKYSVYACIIATGLLCYGGVSVFVIVFAVFPIFVECFRRANLPSRLLPGAIAFGPFTWASCFFPGSPAINNIVPADYLGTSLMGGAAVGMISGIVCLAFGLGYLTFEFKRAKAHHEGFVPNQVMLAVMEDQEGGQSDNVSIRDAVLALVDMALLIVLINVFKVDVVLTMVVSCILLFVFFWNKISDKIETVGQGISGSFAAIINTSAVVGFGSVVKMTGGFNAILDWITTLNGNPLLSLGIATGAVCGATGSGSGGISIVMDTLANRYLEMGISPQIIHRISTIASCTFDSLPHNGAIITLLTVCGFTHKEGYLPIFMLTVVTPFVGTLSAIAAAGILG